MEQTKPVLLKEYTSVNASSFGEKVARKVRELTPAGRMEKYRARYTDVLSQATGAERYFLMQKVDSDAKKYAWKTFTRDVVVAAASIGAIVYGGMKVKEEKNIGDAWKAIRAEAKHKFTLVGQFPKKVWKQTNDAASELGGSLTRGGIIEIAQDAPVVADLLLDNISAEAGRRAVIGGATSVAEATGIAMDFVAKYLHRLQDRLKQSRS